MQRTPLQLMYHQLMPHSSVQCNPLQATPKQAPLICAMRFPVILGMDHSPAHPGSRAYARIIMDVPEDPIRPAPLTGTRPAHPGSCACQSRPGHRHSAARAWACAIEQHVEQVHGALRAVEPGRVPWTERSRACYWWAPRRQVMCSACTTQMVLCALRSRGMSTLERC